LKEIISKMFSKIDPLESEHQWLQIFLIIALTEETNFENINLKIFSTNFKTLYALYLKFLAAFGLQWNMTQVEKTDLVKNVQQIYFGAFFDS